MCTVLKSVARDGDSTCSICGGKDAYGGSPSRGAKYHKVLASKKSGAAANVPPTAARKEAAYHAFDCGQVKEKWDSLISEDLW
jgi:hypothetical protein